MVTSRVHVLINLHAGRMLDELAIILQNIIMCMTLDRLEVTVPVTVCVCMCVCVSEATI